MGILAISALSCTSKLEQEIDQLKEQLNSKFELIIENPNVFIYDDLEELRQRIAKVPYSLKGSNGRVSVTARCNSEYGDAIKAVVEPSGENSGLVKVFIRECSDDVSEGDGQYIDYSRAEVYVTAVDESGKTSVQTLRLPKESFCISGSGSIYKESPSIEVDADANNAEIEIVWNIEGEKNYFPQLENFKIPFKFESPESSSDVQCVMESHLIKDTGSWGKLSYTSNIEQKTTKYAGTQYKTGPDMDFFSWEGKITYTIQFDKNTTGSQRIVVLSLMRVIDKNTVSPFAGIYLIQNP